MVYILSDIRLSDPILAEQSSQSIDEYNSSIISKINSTIYYNDKLFLFGITCAANDKNSMSCFSDIRGQKYIVNSELNPFTVREWHGLGAYRIFSDTFSLQHDGIYIPSKQDFLIPDNTEYIVVAAQHNPKVVLEGNRLSMEAKYWDYSPLLVDDGLKTLIDDMKLFSSMEV